MNEKRNARLGFNYFNPPEELTRDQMKNLIDTILDVGFWSEREHDCLLSLFKRFCKHPGGSDVIYWPNLAGFARPLEADEILKVAMGEPLEGGSYYFTPTASSV